MRGLYLLSLCVLALQASAADGRLRGSGGLLSVEGAAGGGLVPWAVIAGHGERGEWDLVAGATVVDTGDFDLRSTALALAWDNRLELSYARMSLGLDALVERGLFPDRRLDTEVLGAKLRLGGDLIYGSGPQVSLGLQWRRSRDPDLVMLASAENQQGADVYLSASKLWVDGIGSRRTLASLTLRSTTAHQLGLAGFSAGGQCRGLCASGLAAGRRISRQTRSTGVCPRGRLEQCLCGLVALQAMASGPGLRGPGFDRRHFRTARLLLQRAGFTMNPSHDSPPRHCEPPASARNSSRAINRQLARRSDLASRPASRRSAAAVAPQGRFYK